MISKGQAGNFEGDFGPHTPPEKGRRRRKEEGKKKSDEGRHRRWARANKLRPGGIKRHMEERSEK